ncbi:hypothetical protein [Vibrio owensii]|uniref:hypothetical protein n=1 Tax=Vibrio owensii TaxID=696485 RepID=UPI003D9FF588
MKKLVFTTLLTSFVSISALAANNMPMDTNGDGVISQEEAKGNLAKNFSMIDTNGDGVINSEELQSHLDEAANKAKETMKNKKAEMQNSKHF